MKGQKFQLREFCPGSYEQKGREVEPSTDSCCLLLHLAWPVWRSLSAIRQDFICQRSCKEEAINQLLPCQPPRVGEKNQHGSAQGRLAGQRGSVPTKRSVW